MVRVHLSVASKLLLICVIAAADFMTPGTAGTFSGACCAVRTADALDALLLFLTDIKNCRAQDQYNKRKNE